MTKRGVRASSISVGDRGRVRGPLFGDNVRVGDRADVEAVYAKTVELGERCRCTLVHGVDLRIESGCRVLGEVLYSGSLETDEGVLFTVPPKKVDILPPEPN